MTPPEMGTPHSVAFYDTDSDLVGRALPYLRAGLVRDESLVVVVSRRAERALRDALGAEAHAVCWRVPGADLRHLGAGFEALRAFLDRRCAAGTPTRLVMEDDGGSGIGRGPARTRADAVTNEVWAGYGFPWLCLYDRHRFRPTTIEQVARVHPLLVDAAGAQVANPGYVAAEHYVAERPGPLSAVPETPALDLRPRALVDLPTVRHRVVEVALRLGLSEDACREVELATGEVVTNAFEHGRPPHRVRVWTDRGAVVVRVDDGGPGTGLATAGLRPPEPGVLTGRGMWVVRQVAAVVHVGTGPDGTGVELQFPLPEAVRDRADAPGPADSVLAAFDQAPLMLGAYEGPELVAVALNAAARSLAGDLQALGTPLREFLALVDDGRVLEAVEQVYATGRALAVRAGRWCVPGPDGVREIRIDYECTPWLAADGRIRGVLATAREVSEGVSN